jgi:glutamate dehydrogenase
VRPELAVLLAYSKIALYEDLLASDVPDDPLLAEDLLRYFPSAMVERWRADVDGHRLRREIIATYITNSTVNRVGPSFVYRMTETTGRSSQDVARAYTITRDCLDLRRMWAEIEALDNQVPAALQVRMLLDLARLSEHSTLWFLQRHAGALDVSRVVETFRGPLRELAGALEELLPALAKRELKRHARELVKQGVPEDLARQVAASRPLGAGTEIVSLALAANTAVERVARVYWALGERFTLDWLRTAATQAKIETPWQRAALEVMLDELARRQSTIARQALAEAPPESEWRDVVEGWAAKRSPRMDRACKLLGELRATGGVDLAMMTLALSALERLAGE